MASRCPHLVWLASTIALLHLASAGCGSSSGTADPSTAGAGDGGPDANGSADAATDATSRIDAAAPYLPQGVPIGSNSVRQVLFTDAANGLLLLAGSTPDTRGVWATADTGATWVQREIDIVPGGLAFTADLARLWVVGSSSASSLWASSDRGATFMPLTWTNGEPGRVVFLDASTVLVPDYLGAALYRSGDNGATWTTQDFSGTFNAAHIAVVGRDVWLAGGQSFLQTGAHVSHSTDAGVTFSTTTLTDNAHTFEGGALQAIGVTSPTEVWVAGDSRQVFHTTDTGQTWTQLKGIPATFDAFGGIDVNGPHVTIAGSSADGYALYRSDDGGASFHAAEEIRCPGRCGRVRGVATAGPDLLFVYGDGLLWRLGR